MAEYEKLGSELREFLRGLLQVESVSPVVEWGPRIDSRGLEDLFAPQQIKPFTATPAGIDNLHLTSTDVFYVPGKGEFTAEFAGYFRVARAEPTTRDWATADVHVNMLDIFLEGEAKGVGTIQVRANPRMVSPGQVFASGRPTGVSKCRIAAGVTFEVPGMSRLFNKEPILLMNDGIRSIPPVEDSNGLAHIYRLPLYQERDPNGRPVAYLVSLRYTVGDYITREEAMRIQHRFAE